MAEFPAMPLWTDSHLADTTHLNDAEHGLYIRMLIYMWRMPKRKFPNDNGWLSRKLGKPVDDVITKVRPLIQEFFTTDGNWIMHGRLEKEFMFVKEQHQKQSDRAKSRWNKQKNKCRGSTHLHANDSGNNVPSENDSYRNVARKNHSHHFRFGVCSSSDERNPLQNNITSLSHGNAPTPIPLKEKEERKLLVGVLDSSAATVPDAGVAQGRKEGFLNSREAKQAGAVSKGGITHFDPNALIGGICQPMPRGDLDETEPMSGSVYVPPPPPEQRPRHQPSWVRTADGQFRRA